MLYNIIYTSINYCFNIINIVYMCFDSCFGYKKKILAEFYKDKPEKLLTQLTNYINDLFNSNYYIISNSVNKTNDIYILFENELNNKLYVYCDITDNKFNHKLSVYRITHS